MCEYGGAVKQGARDGGWTIHFWNGVLSIFGLVRCWHYCWEFLFLSTIWVVFLICLSLHKVCVLLSIVNCCTSIFKQCLAFNYSEIYVSAKYCLNLNWILLPPSALPSALPPSAILGVANVEWVGSVQSALRYSYFLSSRGANQKSLLLKGVGGTSYNLDFCFLASSRMLRMKLTKIILSLIYLILLK